MLNCGVVLDGLWTSLDTPVYSAKPRHAYRSYDVRQLDAYAGFFTYKVKILFKRLIVHNRLQAAPAVGLSLRHRLSKDVYKRLITASLDAVSALGYRDSAVRARTVGIGTPCKAANSRIVRQRLFSCSGAQFMGDRARAVARLAGALPVVSTFVRSPTLIGTGVGGYHTATKATIMNTLTVLSASIRQLDGLYSLNDLHKASGAAPKHRPSQFMRLDTTKALIEEIQCADQRTAAKSINGGSGRGSYACKELVYAYAMWISPSFHLKVIRAFDALHTPPAAPAKPLPPPPFPPEVFKAVDAKANALGLSIIPQIRDALLVAIGGLKGRELSLILMAIDEYNLNIDRPFPSRFVQQSGDLIHA